MILLGLAFRSYKELHRWYLQQSSEDAANPDSGQKALLAEWTTATVVAVTGFRSCCISLEKYNNGH